MILVDVSVQLSQRRIGRHAGGELCDQYMPSCFPHDLLGQVRHQCIQELLGSDERASVFCTQLT